MIVYSVGTSNRNPEGLDRSFKVGGLWYTWKGESQHGNFSLVSTVILEYSGCDLTKLCSSIPKTRAHLHYARSNTTGLVF